MKIVEKDMENNQKSDCDHNWEFVADWEGDPDLPNGTHDLSHWRCLECGLEQIETPEGYEPDFEDLAGCIDRQNSKGEYESDFVYDPFRRDP